MEEQRTSLCNSLPTAIARLLLALPLSQWEQVQEVRLRVGAPMMLSRARENIPLGVTLTAQQVRDCFICLCGQAVHAHQEELRHGFITTREGFRVGVAGTAVMREGTVTSYRDITSLCIRIPRAADGCALPLLAVVDNDDRVNGVLLCGAPASGKTTLLRDLAKQLSRKYRVAVIDERRELAFPSLTTCDVLSGCPKATGIWQAVRTLSPDAVIVDEIGDHAEWQVVSEAMFCGVAVIASVHAGCERELLARTQAAKALQNGGFAHVVFLPPRGNRQENMRIRKAAELVENDGSDADRVGVRRCGGASDVAAL